MAKEYSYILVTETWDDVGFSHDITISLCEAPGLELEHLYQSHLQKLELDFTGLNDIEIENLLEEHDIEYEEEEYFSGKDEYCFFRYTIIPLEDRVTGKNISVVIKE